MRQMTIFSWRRLHSMRLAAQTPKGVELLRSCEGRDLETAKSMKEKWQSDLLCRDRSSAARGEATIWPVAAMKIAPFAMTVAWRRRLVRRRGRAAGFGKEFSSPSRWRIETRVRARHRQAGESRRVEAGELRNAPDGQLQGKADAPR